MGDAMKTLSVDRGCTTCHPEEPAARGSGAILASAPSWREIAARHRERAGAEEQFSRP